jgi:hypothetical protein
MDHFKCIVPAGIELDFLDKSSLAADTTGSGERYRSDSSVTGRYSELGFNPAVDAGVQQVKRESAAGQDLVVKGL